MYNLKYFDYSKLHSYASDIIDQLYQYGFITIKNVPKFSSTYQEFINSAKNFINLSDEEKNKYTPTNYYISGWSYGVEIYDKYPDKYKGSYYANFPDSLENIWPEDTTFKENYLALANIIFKTGKEILSLIECYSGNMTGVTRMLHYKAIKEEEKDLNPDWCGLHRDHSLFTGLCPELYFKNGVMVEKPKNSGLIIQGKEINIDNDILLFQVGEAAQLVTKGKLTATEHKVKKAPIGYERYTFVFFFNADPNFKIYSDIKEYSDRFVQGMAYKDWLEAPFKKYQK